MDDSYKLYELPAGWCWTRLGEICNAPQYGWTTSAKSNGSLHLLRTTDITSGKINWGTVPFCSQPPTNEEKYLIQDGDILISRAGSIGYSILVKNPPNAVFASYLIRFKPLIDKYYIAYFLKSHIYWGSIFEKRLGIAIPNINANKLKLISIPLPPLPEQHRIVAKIEELFTKLDAGVETLKRIKKQLKRYRQSVLKYAFEGKLTEKWREIHKDELEPASVLLKRIKEERKKTLKGKYKELPPVNTKGLPELPEGWCWVRVGEITESMKNGIYKPKHFYSDDGTACLRMYNIENGHIVWKDIKRMDLTLSEIDEYQLKPGDILVNRVNSRELVGKAAPILPGIEACVYESKNIRLRLSGKCKYKYASFWFQIFSQGYFNRNAQQTVGMASINQEQIAYMPIPLPSLQEQHAIVQEIETRFSIADEVEKIIENSLKKSRRLRQSILKQAFEGKLVPQDSNDEPAEKLLERIKAEKAKLESEKKITRKTKNKEVMKENHEQLRLYNGK